MLNQDYQYLSNADWRVDRRQTVKNNNTGQTQTREPGVDPLT